MGTGEKQDCVYRLYTVPVQPPYTPLTSPSRPDRIIDDKSKVAASTDARFFAHIFSRAKAGLGMATYEQDFLTKTYESVGALQSTVGAAKAWLQVG